MTRIMVYSRFLNGLNVHRYPRRQTGLFNLALWVALVKFVMHKRVCSTSFDSYD